MKKTPSLEQFHALLNGLYETRALALVKEEDCEICARIIEAVDRAIGTASKRPRPCNTPSLLSPFK